MNSGVPVTVIPAAAMQHCGPSRAICAVCGEEIPAYESRQFGETGAVHVFEPDCYRLANQRLYPYYYTDG